MSENKDNSTTAIDPGYTPLKIERREGKLWLADGTLLMPSIEVGTEDYHLELFIEYERTFGRGNAKLATHLGEENSLEEELYGADFITEWQDIARDYTRITYRGTKAEADSLIKQMAEYRLRHKNLYRDKDQRERVKPTESRIKVISTTPIEPRKDVPLPRIKLIRK